MTDEEWRTIVEAEVAERLEVISAILRDSYKAAHMELAKTPAPER